MLMDCCIVIFTNVDGEIFGVEICDSSCVLNLSLKNAMYVP